MSRRDENAAATRTALVEGAARLFTEDGYQQVSVERIAARARVTKGAVYHWFPTKKALFQAALELVDDRTMSAITAATETAPTPWDMLERGLDAFLDRCLAADYQRICFHDGPRALGFVTWWEHAESHVEGALTTILTTLSDDDLITTTSPPALATTLYGALTAAALAISRADDPQTTRDLMGVTINELLHGLRAEPPDTMPE